MNRKNFITSMLPLAAMPLLSRANNEEEVLYRKPPSLRKGDVIGICCVAGNITSEDVQPAVNKLQEWGYAVKVGNTIGKKDFTFGGTDTERLQDFQLMLDDTGIKAIMCARGGYGSIRIVDAINFKKFVSHPKWIIGFSDVTVLHAHINRNYNIVTMHSKMCNSFPKVWAEAEPIQQQTILSINQCLTGVAMQYDAPANSNNKMGKATGVLIGGNLKTLETLAGSKSDIITDGKILFVEDTGEYLYSIDRMFWNLKRSGKLSKLKGLIIGGFKVKPAEDVADEFGKSLYEIVLEKVNEYNYPVCFDFPVGHQKNNYALKCGVKHELTITAAQTTLKEL
jgi:muramoyltetrapeptide carboxypeptidase